MSLDIHNPRLGQHLIDEFLQMVRWLWALATPDDYKLKLAWVKGHSESEGNSKADEEAKAVAEGKVSQVDALPRFLQGKALPKSSSALWQKHMQDLKSLWREQWALLPWHPKLTKIDPTMPSNKYQGLIAQLNQSQASLVIQLRIGHVALNTYLYRIKKANSPQCQACWAGCESVHHFLFECQVWKSEQWLLGKALG